MKKKITFFKRQLNVSARSDIRWWSLYATQRNTGTKHKAHPTRPVTSDASGSWGCGAFSDHLWFQLKWPAAMGQCHISIKEMIPIVIAAATWGHTWTGQLVHFRSDNAAVINAGSSKDDSLMHLLRFVTAKFHFVVSASHIRGGHNVLANALSRNDLKSFLSNYTHRRSPPHPSSLGHC